MNDESEDAKNLPDRSVPPRGPIPPSRPGVLDYQTLSTTKNEFRTVQFISGFFGGTASSSCLYFIGVQIIPHLSPFGALVALAVVKLIAGTYLLDRRTYRTLGIGILTSMPLSCLIFTGITCGPFSKGL